MRKGTFKIRVFAAALTAASVFGPAATAFNFTSYAAEENIFTENGKQIGIEFADAAFDTIADLFPGGKLVLAPFKTLFHAGVDDKDPMEVISEKLGNMDNKLNQLDQKLTDLNNNINRNTQWMAGKMQNIADLSDLRADFKGLSPEVAKFVKDVKAIETNKNLTKSQKIMQLAALTDSARYDRITTYVHNIKKAMEAKDVVYVDMFKALYTKAALTKMFAREAYREAYPVAEALTMQYAAAVALMQECQVAVKAVAAFDENNIAELGTGKDLALYKGFNLYRHSMDEDDAKEALAAAAEGVKRFKEYDKPVYINKDAETKGKVVKLGQSEGYEYIWNKKNGKNLGIEEKVKANALTTAELTEIADYVRANYPGKSLYDFLVKDMGIKSDIDKRSYIILSDKINISKKRNESLDRTFPSELWGSCYRDCRGYDRKGTVKAIKVSDTKVEVVDLTIFTYKSWDNHELSVLWGVTYDFRELDGSSSYVRMVRVF